MTRRRQRGPRHGLRAKWFYGMLRSEALEPRRLLNADSRWFELAASTDGLPEVLKDPAFLAEQRMAPIEWAGQVTLAYQDQWIVKLRDESPKLRTASGDMVSLLSSAFTTSSVVAADAPAVSSSPLRDVRPLGPSNMLLVETAGIDYDQIRSTVGQLSSVEYVEPNFVVWEDATIPNDPSFGNLWGLNNTGQSGGTPDADIDAPEAWDTNTGSSSVVVGVIDSGVDYNHEDLADNMWRNPGEIAGDGIDNDGNGYVDDIFGWDFRNNDNDPFDDRGHGTHVAGTIAAVGNNGVGISGVSWNAQIMALKFLGASGTGSTADAVAALNYATMMKRDYGVNVVLTNNSWGGGGFSSTLRDAIIASGNENMLFIAAAGNDNVDTDLLPHYPSSYDLDNIISVAATDRNDQKASFSNIGATSVDLGAPGVSVYSTLPGNTYGNYNGTSMATPHVAGVAALLYDSFPTATAADIKAAILAGVDPIPAMADVTVTGGRLNARGALEQMGMHVSASQPAANEVVTAPPTTFTIQTSHPYDPATVDASDLTVNGVAADSVTLAGPNDLIFDFVAPPVTAEGLQTMQIADGAILRDADGDPIRQFDRQFRFDLLPMQVVATTPADGSLVTLPLTTIQVQLNEAVDPASVDPSDLQLSDGTVVGAQVVAADVVEYTIADIVHDGTLAIDMPAGALTDGFGNPMLAYSGSLQLDVVSATINPFQRIEPLGSLVVASRTNTGLLHDAADTDDFTFFLEAGENTTIVIRPDDPAATLTAELLGLTGAVTAPAPGTPLVLGPVSVAADGTQTLRIAGDITTTYSFDVYRNASIESYDSTAAVPLAIDSSRLELGSARYAVVGSIQPTFTTVSVEPDDFAAGTVLNAAVPGVVLSDEVSGGNVTAATSSVAPTGNQVFASPAHGAAGWRDTSALLRADFDLPTDFVSITAGSDDSSDVSRLQAFDAGGALLAEAVSRGLASGQSETLTISRPQADIAYVTAGGINGDISPLDLLVFNEPMADTDVYTIDLNQLGATLDIVLVGQQGADYSTGQLELIAPDGTTIVATASPAPLGTSLQNADLAILGYQVAETGTYQIRFSDSRAGQYTLAVFENLTFDSESNDDSLTDPLRSIVPGQQTVGWVDNLPPVGEFDFTLDSGLSSLTISGVLVDPVNMLELPLDEQSPGSLTAQLQGTARVEVTTSTIRILDTTAIDATEQGGNFLPGNAPADLAAQIELLPGFFGYATLRDTMFSGFSFATPYDANGQFASSLITLTTTAGTLEAEIPGILSENLDISGLFIENQAATPSTIEFFPDSLRITVLVSAQLVVAIPQTGLIAQLDVDGQVVAVADIPAPRDTYEVVLAAGQTVNLATDTLLNHPSTTPLNTLDPRLVVLDSGGGLLASDDNSAPDGVNAALQFTAPADGTYYVQVEALTGAGEYRLRIDDPPLAAISGPASGVPGQPRSYTLTANSPLIDPADVLTFEIDWDGDSLVDEVVTGPSGLQVEHVFTETGSYNINVTAVHNTVGRSLPAQQPINITLFDVQADEVNPAVTNLAWGGTAGLDAVFFIPTAGNSLTVFTAALGNVLINQVDLVSGIDGRIIAYGLGGADIMAADFATVPVEFYGDNGNDVLSGSAAAGDLLDGGAGDDMLLATTGINDAGDTLLGGDGRDFLFAHLGADSLDGGAGEDLLIAGNVAFNNGSLLTGLSKIRNEWLSSRDYATRVANISGTGSGPRLNDNFFLIPGQTVFSDAATDQLLGGNDLDWFLYGFLLDTAQDPNPSETQTNTDI